VQLEVIMRGTLIAFACSIVSVTCTDIAAAQEIKVSREAQSGVESRISWERGWDRDCKTVPITVTVTQQPTNGTISVAQGTSTIPESTPRSGSTGDCAGKTVTGNEVKYRSNPGFRGTDTVKYNLARNNAPAGSMTITINVK
jgi:hypothetical protein